MNLLYTTLYGFFTIIVGQLIISEEYKLIFYLTMLLLYITINNIEYSIRYYIRLSHFFFSPILVYFQCIQFPQICYLLFFIFMRKSFYTQ